MDVIQPFSFVSEDEAQVLLKEIEEQKAKVKKSTGSNMLENNEGAIEVIHERRFKIENKDNPFLNACKKVFGFIKDNVNIGVHINPDLATSNGVVAQPTDRLKSFKPKLTMSVGPVEVELNSDILKKPLDRIRTY